MTTKVPLQDNLIIDKTFQFAVRRPKFPQFLQLQKQYILVNQLQRSGTSKGTKVREVQNAENKVVFIYKFKIAPKEVEETELWLALCKELHNHSDLNAITEQLIKKQTIINNIISTSKKAFFANLLIH